MTVQPLVGAFEHLPNRPKSNEARCVFEIDALRQSLELTYLNRPLLEKIASQVKPIMSKRGWKVGTLAEVRITVCPSWQLASVTDTDRASAAMLTFLSSFPRTRHFLGSTSTEENGFTFD